MRYLQWIIFCAIAVLGIRWAYKEGSKPPDEHRRWVWGYDDDGNPIYDDEEELDIDKTLALNKELAAWSRL